MLAAIQGLLFIFRDLATLWCFLFCKEYVTLLQGTIKKIGDQSSYNVIFYLRRTEHK